MTVPAAVIWEITKQCNFNCPHCIVSSTGKKPEDEMGTEEAKLFIDKFVDAGGKFVFFSGGEPLLRRDLEEIIIYARQRGLEGFTVASNGTLSGNTVPADFPDHPVHKTVGSTGSGRTRIDSLKEAGVRAMQFSLDGHTAELNAKTRGGGTGSFEKTLKAIRLARDAGMKVTVGMFLNPGNIDAIPAMIDLCRHECVPLLRFSGFIPLGRGRDQKIIDNMKYSLEQMKDFFSFVSLYNSQETGVAIGFDHAFGPFMESFSCTAGDEIFYLSSNGDVYPCPSFLHQDFLLGNVFKNNLPSIFSGQKLPCRVPAEKIQGYCSECEDLSWCRGGCRGTAYAYSENINSSFPNCLRNYFRQFTEVFTEMKQFTPQKFTQPGKIRQIPTPEVSGKSIYGVNKKVIKSNKREREELPSTSPLADRELKYSSIFGRDFPGPHAKGTSNIRRNNNLTGSRQGKTQRTHYLQPDRRKYLRPGGRQTASGGRELRVKQPAKTPVAIIHPFYAIEEYYRAHAHNMECAVENPHLLYLLWEATKNCNFLCSHCSSPKEDWDKSKELSTEQAKAVFHRFAQEFDVRQFQALGITGGEPTLRQDLPELVEYFINLGYQVGLDSNGYLMGKNPDLIRKLARAGLRNVCFSLDGLREEFKAFRGIDGFPEVVKAIEFIRKNFPHIFVQTITMVNQHNFDSLDKIYSIIQNLGVEYARFGTVMSIGRAPGDEMNFLNNDQTRKLLAWISSKKRNHMQGLSRLDVEFTDNGWCGRLDEPGGFEGLVRNGCFMCSAGISMGIVTYDGKFGGCLSVDPEMNIQGDLLRESPKEIWNSRFKIFRDKNRLHTGECLECDQWQYCMGGGMHERDKNLKMQECTYRKLKG